MIRSAPALRRGLIALSLPMQRYEKATRTAALKLLIANYNDRWLARQLGSAFMALHVPKAGCKAHALVFSI